MADVIDINAHRPHLSGMAVCTGCDHQWVATAPVGVTQLDCPKCESSKGIWRDPVMPDPIWECNCGEVLFYLSADGAMCRECGTIQVI